jgi:hypothetical protein
VFPAGEDLRDDGSRFIESAALGVGQPIASPEIVDKPGEGGLDVAVGEAAPEMVSASWMPASVARKTGTYSSRLYFWPW